MENGFLLKRITTSSNCPCVEVDFSPVAAAEAPGDSASQSPKLDRSYPVFNLDTHYYTPAFVLGVEKVK